MNDIKIIDEFERAIAKYTGSKYGVAVSSCTNAIFLSLQYLKYIGELKEGTTIIIPSRTYHSVPCTLKNCGLNISFEDIFWDGCYLIYPTRVWDSAVRFTKGMFVGGNNLQCISFQYRKHIKMGRGGMILTDDEDAVRWLKQARFNGRHENISKFDDELEICGWSMYMLPEEAARGLTLFNLVPEDNPDCGGSEDYPDLSKQKVFK